MIAWPRKRLSPARAVPIAPVVVTAATYEVVEPQIRRLVAEHLGVGFDMLGAHVSLRDDLAADSLDLVDLMLVIEASFAIMIPERVLDAVRTYDDLVRTSIRLIRERRTGVSQVPGVA